MNEHRLRQLEARFANALRSIGARGDAATVFEELKARYGEPHRHYHTLTHIDACLAWLDWFCSEAEHPGEVELALWFHDAVYCLGAADNERRSAELAVSCLEALGGEREAVRRVACHIEATASHDALRGDAALVSALDLTILGADPAEFRRFEDSIRREYAAVPEDAFRAGRRQVLEGFLSRDEIYRSRGIRDELESRARANLLRRVRELSPRP